MKCFKFIDVIPLAVQLFAGKCCKFLTFIDIIRLISVIGDVEFAWKPCFKLGEILFCHPIQTEWNAFFFLPLHDIFNRCFYIFIFTCRKCIAVTCTVVPEQENVIILCKFYFVKPCPQIYICKSTVAASAWVLFEIKINKIPVCQFWSFKFCFCHKKSFHIPLFCGAVC